MQMDCMWRLGDWRGLREHHENQHTREFVDTAPTHIMTKAYLSLSVSDSASPCGVRAAAPA